MHISLVARNAKILIRSQIMTMPRLPDRVECMVYRRKLDLEVEEIRPDLDIVREAAQELRVSTRLKQVLKVSHT